MKIKKGNIWGVFLAIACFAPSAMADLCLSHTAFGDKYALGITGSATVLGG